MEDSEEDSDVDEVQNRGRKKVAKKRARRYKNRGYYESSSGGEEADSETSRSPARKKPRETVRNRRRAAGSSPVTTPNISQGNNSTEEASPTVQPQLSTDVRFPPGLLAANPSLAGAKPGSLVVVASPSKSDPSSKLLCVYMVRQKGAQEGGKDKNKPSGVGSTTRAMSPRITLDPAVVRAVDRTRLAEREEGRARGRTVSECKDSTQLIVKEVTASTHRQRTCSEGSGNLRRDLVRQRFLSGTASSMPEVPLTSLATLSTSTNSISSSTIGTCNTIVNSTTTSTMPIARKSKVFRGKKTLPDS